MLKIGSVWKKETDEKLFFSGRVDTPCPVIIDDKLNIIILKNKNPHEKSPDYDVFVSKPKPKEEE